MTRRSVTYWLARGWLTTLGLGGAAFFAFAIWSNPPFAALLAGVIVTLFAIARMQEGR